MIVRRGASYLPADPEHILLRSSPARATQCDDHGLYPAPHFLNLKNYLEGSGAMYSGIELSLHVDCSWPPAGSWPFSGMDYCPEPRSMELAPHHG